MKFELKIEFNFETRFKINDEILNKTSKFHAQIISYQKKKEKKSEVMLNNFIFQKKNKIIEKITCKN